MKKSTVVIIAIVLFWILLWGGFWTYLWYTLLKNNYIIWRNKLISLKEKIEKNNKNKIEKVKEIKNDTELTIKEIKNVIKNEKYKMNYFIIENIVDNQTIADKLNYWLVYGRQYHSKSIIKKISEFIKNDFVVNYRIKNETTNKVELLKLNCLLNIPNLDTTVIKKTYSKTELEKLYCDQNTIDNVKDKVPFLFNKQYNKIESYSIIKQNKLKTSINKWTAPNQIKNILSTYEI